jgi:hypothetical protein
MLRVVDAVRRHHGDMWDGCVFRAGRHFGLGGGSGKDSDGKWLQRGVEKSSSVYALTGGAGKLGCRSFVDVRVSFGRNWVSEEDSRHSGTLGTCLFVFLHKNEGVIAPASQVPFADGVRNVLYVSKLSQALWA